MTKNKYTKFETTFVHEELLAKLSGLTALAAYSFTKRNNPTEFYNLFTFLPEGYVNKQKDNIELIDLVYSGNTNSQLLLTLAVGRNDTFQGQEKFDIDVLNIAPDTSTINSYFSQFWHHFKDKKDNRVSYDIHPFRITNEETKKNVTYGTFLTGSTSYYNFIDYQKEKPDFIEIHNKSFGDINI